MSQSATTSESTDTARSRRSCTVSSSSYSYEYDEIVNQASTHRGGCQALQRCADGPHDRGEPKGPSGGVGLVLGALVALIVGFISATCGIFGSYRARRSAY